MSYLGYLFFILAEFQSPSWLIAVNSDHMCAGFGDWLLINEWEQLWAFPSPCQSRSDDALLWRLKRSREWRTLIILILILSLTCCRSHPNGLSDRNFGLFGPCWDFFVAHLCSFFSRGKLWAFYNLDEWLWKVTVQWGHQHLCCVYLCKSVAILSGPGACRFLLLF